MGLINKGLILDYNLITSDDGLEDSYPVFKDPHPSGQGGPLFTVTDEDRAQMEARLLDFIPLLFGEATASELEIKTNLHEVAEGRVFETKYVELDNINVSAGTKGMTIRIGNEVMNSEVVKNDPASIPYIKTALDYIGITDPVIAEDLSFANTSEDYNVVDYYIYDKAALESEENTFSYAPYVEVSIMDLTSDPMTTVSVFNTLDLLEFESTECPTVPYTDALEYVKATYPDIDMSTLSCRTVYDYQACLGYYLPIYEFFFRNTSDTTSPEYYNDVKISAVEFTPEVILH